MNRFVLSIVLVIVVALCLPSWSLGRRSGAEDNHDAGHHHDSWAVPDQEEVVAGHVLHQDVVAADGTEEAREGRAVATGAASPIPAAVIRDVQS